MSEAGAVVGAVVGVAFAVVLIYNVFWAIVVVRERVRSPDRPLRPRA